MANCPIASARQGGGFTLEQVLSSPFPSDIAAARRGERVAWAFDSEGRRNVWVAEGPQFQARQLTHFDRDDGQELGDLSFSADGNWVVFVRGGEKNRAGDYPNPTSDTAGVKQQVLAANWTTGQVKTLGEGNAPAPSPTGPQVVYSKGEQLWLASLTEPRAEAHHGTRDRTVGFGAHGRDNAREAEHGASAHPTTEPPPSRMNLKRSEDAFPNGDL